MEAKEFSVTQRDLYFTRAEKSNLQSAFVTIFSVKSMKKEMIDNFKWNQHKPLKANDMKRFNESNFAVLAAVKRNHKLRYR